MKTNYMVALTVLAVLIVFGIGIAGAHNPDRSETKSTSNIMDMHNSESMEKIMDSHMKSLDEDEMKEMLEDCQKMMGG